MGEWWTYPNEPVDDLVRVRSIQCGELLGTERDCICGIILVDELILVGSDSRGARRHTGRSYSVVHAPKFAFKCPALHLLVPHELLHASRHAEWCERHPAVERAPTFVLKYACSAQPSR
jgi:hypothetical protein